MRPIAGKPAPTEIAQLLSSAQYLGATVLLKFPKVARSHRYSDNLGPAIHHTCCPRLCRSGNVGQRLWVVLKK